MELGIFYQTAWVKYNNEVVNVAYTVSHSGTMECLRLDNMDVFESTFEQITERPVEEEVV